MKMYPILTCHLDASNTQHELRCPFRSIRGFFLKPVFPPLFLRNALKHATVFWYCLRHMTVTDKLRQDKCRLCVSVRWVLLVVDGALLNHLSSLQAWSI
jgi:hypothetical protein